MELGEEERQVLKALVSRGRAAAYRQTHARILLLSDENQAEGPMKDEEIARSLKVGNGGAGAAALRGMVWSVPWGANTEPAAETTGWSGRGLPWRWPAANHRRGGPGTLKLLANRLVGEIVERVSSETVRRTFSSPG